MDGEFFSCSKVRRIMFDCFTGKVIKILAIASKKSFDNMAELKGAAAQPNV